MNTIRWKTSSFIKMRIIVNCKEMIFSFFLSFLFFTQVHFLSYTNRTVTMGCTTVSFFSSFFLSPLSFIHRSLTFSHILSVSDCVIEKSMDIIFSYQEKWSNNWNHNHFILRLAILTIDVFFLRYNWDSTKLASLIISVLSFIFRGYNRHLFFYLWISSLLYSSSILSYLCPLTFISSVHFTANVNTKKENTNAKKISNSECIGMRKREMVIKENI